MTGVSIMIANLPLLFANGNPTALSKITAQELEKFITFMVTCSWGHDTARDIKRPPWWPLDVFFTHPFRNPQNIPKNWEMRLKKLVRRCYDYHKSAFLLVFSAQLARYPRKRLRYVDNSDSTTSLYFIPTGRLLVTFRNENLFYDRHKIPICRRPFRSEPPQVRPADIYLCDNCDSHFDNIDLLRSHERLCNNQEVLFSPCSGGLPEFLAALKLKPATEKLNSVPENVLEAQSRQLRASVNIDRGPPFPFSSLAYLRNIKSNAQRDLTYSRERVERYCISQPNTGKSTIGKSKNNQYPIRYRRPIDYWHRKHTFPNQRNKTILDIKAQLLLLKCKPITVNVEKMSIESMQDYIEKLKEESKHQLTTSIDKDIEFVGDFEGDHLMEEDLVKVVDPLNRIDSNCGEVIDLCSDDENQSANENCDPRAGVTCVMRGGAVLRRTASTPNALPDEPCGARHRAMPHSILQRHPVILFAQSISNLQTISID